MSVADGMQSKDVAKILAELRASWRGDPEELHRFLRHYYLCCCRRIWKLLPMEESRRCVEVAERHLDRLATNEELSSAEWHAEGASLLLYHEKCDPDEVARCIEEVERIQPAELLELLGPANSSAWNSTREMLAKAAYFVVIVACYPDISPIDNIEVSYGSFLSATFLREAIVTAGDCEE